MNERFIGAWLLHTYETLQPDGETVYPYGERPRGMFSFAATGYFSVQLGPGEPEPGRYTAFYGTLDVTEGETGVLTGHLQTGSNPEQMSGEQVRRFRFVDPDTLKLQPPAAADGAQSTITWRRAK